MASAGYLLTFHSQNISGNDFASNDHVALDESLRFLGERRVPIVSLRDVALRLRAGTLDELPGKYVAISFDDGPDFDWLPLHHPTAGLQEPMGAILRRHRRWTSWRHVPATSFVIASPVARRDIALHLHPDRMSDEWWALAQASGLLEIGNHGWDHVHPSVEDMKERPELIESFDKVDSVAEARRQVDDAAAYIAGRAGHGAGSLFAYPYGKVSEFLARDYFPRQDRVVAAFTTEPAPVTSACDVWRIPRFVCGPHFRSVEQLEALLSGAPGC
jgi:peptidoglycan/xylan/chitin deacetylase (PgdA/CDA1 family)